MRRSARPGHIVSRRGLLAATAAFAGVVMSLGGLGTSAAACADRDGRGEGGGPSSWVAPARSGSSPADVHVVVDRAPKATGAYVYRKRDATRPASWENSTQQYLVATWSGAAYHEVALEQVAGVLAAHGVQLCGSGWGVQEDQAYGTQAVFTGAPAPSYPDMTIGWPPIFAAQHWSLERFFDVPACAGGGSTAAPSTTPKASPSASVPSAEVGASPSGEASTPAASQSPVTATPAGPTSAPVTVTPRGATTPTTRATQQATTPSPNPSSTPTVVSAVLSAPDSTQTSAPAPSPTVVSAVLAAGGAGGVLAETGAAPVGTAVVATVLLAAGGALLVLRRRRPVR